MSKIKALLLVLILALTAACSEQKATPPAAALADNEENRLAAAKTYLEVVPPQDILKELSDKVVKMLPEKSQKVFLEVMNSKPLQESTYRITLNALGKHFTVNEIKALTVFYGSPEGKAIRHKYGEYMADVMPQINQEVVTALQKVKDPQETQEPKKPEAQAKPAEPKGPQGQLKPAEPKEPQAPAKPVEPQAPKAQPEKIEPQTPKAPAESPGKK